MRLLHYRAGAVCWFSFLGGSFTKICIFILTVPSPFAHSCHKNVLVSVAMWQINTFTFQFRGGSHFHTLIHSLLLLLLFHLFSSNCLPHNATTYTEQYLLLTRAQCGGNATNFLFLLAIISFVPRKSLACMFLAAFVCLFCAHVVVIIAALLLHHS